MCMCDKKDQVQLCVFPYTPALPVYKAIQLHYLGLSSQPDSLLGKAHLTKDSVCRNGQSDNSLHVCLSNLQPSLAKSCQQRGLHEPLRREGWS